MACPTADMNGCNKKCKCVGGPCAGRAYDCADPCNGGVFIEESCECFDTAGLWRALVSWYIAPGGWVGYSDLDCGKTTPATVTGVHKTDLDSGPTVNAWNLPSNAYMFTYIDNVGTDPTAYYYRREGDPTGTNTQVKWNKTLEYYRGSRTDIVGGSGSPIYVRARNSSDQIVSTQGGTSAIRVDDTDFCGRGLHRNAADPEGYIQGISNVVYQKWNGTAWEDTPV